MPSTFKTYLDTLVDTSGFVPESWSFEHQRLIELFKGNDEDVDSLLALIEQRLDADGTWSMAKFLESRITDGAIAAGHYQRVSEWVSSHIFCQKLPESTFISLMNVYFSVELSIEKKREFIALLLSKEERYSPKLHLTYIAFHDLTHLSDEFPSIFLSTLNTPKWNHLWMMWHGKFVSTIAKSPKLASILLEITLKGNEHALKEFVDMGEAWASAFFDNLPTDKQVADKVADFLRHALETDDDSVPLFLSHTLYQVEDFRKKSLEYLNRCGVSVFDFLFPYLESHGWDFYAYVAQYIRPEEVSRLPEVYKLGSWYFFWIFDRIVEGDRVEKGELIASFQGISWFSEEWQKVQGHRKEQEELRKAEEAKRTAEIRSEIQSCIDATSPSQVHPRVLELFDIHRDLFTSEQEEEVAIQVKRFFSWDLFPIESVTITRHIDPNGWKSHSGGFWYMQGYFCLALRIAKEKLGLDVSSLISRKSLVRALPFNYLDSASENMLFDAINGLSDDEARDILTIYDGSRWDDLAGLWWGQNFFPFIERFKSDLIRPSNLAHFREALKWWILHESEYHWWEGTKALQCLMTEWVLDQESDIPMLKGVFSAWKEAMEKNPEGTIGDLWNVHLSANSGLIRLKDEESILWRFQQLWNNKISVSDPTDEQSWVFFRSISEIESEITHGGAYIRIFRGIDTEKFESEILGIIDHALGLLDEDRVAYGEYARYLLSGMFWVLEGRESGIAELLSRIEEVYARHDESARFLGGFALRDFQWAKIRSLEPEKKDAVALSLLGEVRALRASARKTEARISESKVMLLVEGVSDLEHVRNAWSTLGHLFPPEMNFEIRIGRSAAEIKFALQAWDIRDDEILIGLLDFDEAGFQEAFLKLKSVNLNRSDVYNSCASISGVPVCKWWDERKNVHALLLPVTSEGLLDGQVFNPGKQVWPMFEPKTIFYNWKPYFVIEHLFYGIDERFDATYFESVDYPGYADGRRVELSKAEIWNNLFSKKHSFAETIRRRAKEEFWIEPADLYRNFLPLFKKIQSIIYVEPSE